MKHKHQNCPVCAFVAASGLTDMQHRYVNYRVQRYSPPDAARLAGYKDPGPESSSIYVKAHNLEKNVRVQKAIHDMREAICEQAMLMVRKGKPVSDRALCLLMEWDRSPPYVRYKAASAIARRGLL